MAENVLEIRDLSLSYGDDDIVRNVNLSVKAGEILCIAGESGCGKSTLLKAIHGMDAINVTAGDIVYEGKSILGMPASERRRMR